MNDDDEEAMWETPAAGVRRLRNRGGGDGSSAGATHGAAGEGEWQRAPGAEGAHVWVPRPARDRDRLPDVGDQHHDPRDDFDPDYRLDHTDVADDDHELERCGHDYELERAGHDHELERSGHAYELERPDRDFRFGSENYDHDDHDDAEDAHTDHPDHGPPRIPYDTALTAFASRPRRRRIPAKLLIVLTLFLAAFIAALVLVAPRRPAWPPPDWIFAACDVGQGDGLVLADGPHTGIVVDTGPDPDKENRCLTSLGITHVRLLLLTHFHADHIDGVPAVLDHRTVDEIETTILDDPPEGARKVAAWASAAGVPVSRASVNEHRVYGAVSWDVLWPDPSLLGVANANAPPGSTSTKRSRSRRSSGSGGGTSSGGSSSRGTRRSSGKSEEGSAPNNASIVLHVRVTTTDGPVTLLLTGDIEPPAQAAILARTPNLAADILKVPHHGSAHQDPDLVARVRPRAAVISVGKGNTYGHPAPRTLTLAGSTGARVFRTDDDGTVLVVGPASRLHVVLNK